MSQRPRLQPVNPGVSNNKATDRYLTSESSGFMSPLPDASACQLRNLRWRNTIPPHSSDVFLPPEHTCEDKSLLIQRWDEWQHCVCVCASRKEGMLGPQAQPSAAQRAAQCCCCHTSGADKNIWIYTYTVQRLMQERVRDQKRSTIQKTLLINSCC